MAGRGSYGALPAADFADEHDHGHDPVMPPVSTGARRRNILPENGGAHVDGYHFTAAAHATDGLGVQAPTSGAFGAALQGHRDGSRPANVAETLQGTALSLDICLCDTHMQFKSEADRWPHARPQFLQRLLCTQYCLYAGAFYAD